MGYQMPNVYKEIYLPISPNDDLSISEYKEKYGVDLREYLTLEDDTLHFYAKNTKVHVVYVDFDESLINNNMASSVIDAKITENTAWIEGEQEARLVLGGENFNPDIFGILFAIPMAKECILDNVAIGSAY